MFKESNKEVEERFLLTKERIEEIAAGEKNGMNENIQNYFKKTAQLLKKCAEDFVCISSDAWKSRSFEQLKNENEQFYHDILPQNYEQSFADPAFAVQELGEEFGRILSFLYTELRSERAFVFEQNLEKITILNELFLEIYCMFEEGDVTYKQIKDTIYWFLYDYADDWAGYRVRELVDPALDFATSIIMDSDLLDLTYLMRKSLEKNGWDRKKGMTILESYAKKADLAKDEQEFIYIMLLFPEKYWKLLNGYFNHKKSWFSEQSLQKLRSLDEMEQCREQFLKNYENGGSFL